MVTRAQSLGVEVPISNLACIHVAAYEAGRSRIAAASSLLGSEKALWKNYTSRPHGQTHLITKHLWGAGAKLAPLSLRSHPFFREPRP